MILLKCCTQYASKFGRHSSGHRTGQGQFSFQTQRPIPPGLLCGATYKAGSVWARKKQLPRFLAVPRHPHPCPPRSRMVWEFPDLRFLFGKPHSPAQTHTFPFSMYFFISISILSITQHKEDHYHRPLTPSISWIGFKSTLVCLLSTLPKAKARPQGLIIA